MRTFVFGDDRMSGIERKARRGTHLPKRGVGVSLPPSQPSLMPLPRLNLSSLHRLTDDRRGQFNDLRLAHSTHIAH